jgi:hypothetical protein
MQSRKVEIQRSGNEQWVFSRCSAPASHDVVGRGWRCGASAASWVELLPLSTRIAYNFIPHSLNLVAYGPTHITAICTHWVQWVQETIAHSPEKYLYEEILDLNVFISYMRRQNAFKIPLESTLFKYFLNGTRQRCAE